MQLFPRGTVPCFAEQCAHVCRTCTFFQGNTITLYAHPEDTIEDVKAQDPRRGRGLPQRLLTLRGEAARGRAHDKQQHCTLHLVGRLCGC
jgi:hypothetical protein